MSWNQSIDTTNWVWSTHMLLVSIVNHLPPPHRGMLKINSWSPTSNIPFKYCCHTPTPYFQNLINLIIFRSFQEISCFFFSTNHNFFTIVRKWPLIYSWWEYLLAITRALGFSDLKIWIEKFSCDALFGELNLRSSFETELIDFRF